MPQLDLQSLVVALIALGVAIGAPLAVISGPRRGTGTLWYWALSLLALSSGSLLLVLREVIPTILSIMVGNALIICAVAFLGNVASSLTKQYLDGTNRWFFAAITAPVLGFLYLTVDAIWPRVAYMAAVECYLVGQLAWQLRRNQMASGQPQRKPVLAFEILLWIFLTETAVRIVSTIALKPGGDFSRQTLVSVAFLIAILLVALVTCVLIWHEMDTKDEAIRSVRSTDFASGLPNQVVFLQMLEGRLAAMAATGGGSVALLRVVPVRAIRAHLYPMEEAAIYLTASRRIEQVMDRLDVLARISDDEFGILFHGSDTAQSVEVLERALSRLQSKVVVGDRDQYHLNATAALIACDPSISSAAEVARILRNGLFGVLAGNVRVLATPHSRNANGANGTNGT
jgi:GGDEF domain-containing protein